MKLTWRVRSELQIKEVMLDSANETISQLKQVAAEAKEDAAEALGSLRHAEMRLNEMKPAEVESLQYVLFSPFTFFQTSSAICL